MEFRLYFQQFNVNFFKTVEAPLNVQRRKDLKTTTQARVRFPQEREFLFPLFRLCKSL